MFTWKAQFVGLSQALFLLILLENAESRCEFPSYITGEYVFLRDGEISTSEIGTTRWDDVKCVDKYDHEKPDPSTLGQNHTFLVRNIHNDRIYCIDVFWRTLNVLQVKSGERFLQESATVESCDAVQKGLPRVDELVTLFRKESIPIACESIFSGVYHFTYEVNYGDGGICNDPNNEISACLDPDSVFVDNEVFYMRYAKCEDVPVSIDKYIRYLCLGTWSAKRGHTTYTYAAVADTSESDESVKYRCLMAIQNQKTNPKKRWVMSRFSTCENLNSIYDGTVKLEVTKTEDCPPLPWESEDVHSDTRALSLLRLLLQKYE